MAARAPPCTELLRAMHHAFDCQDIEPWPALLKEQSFFNMQAFFIAQYVRTCAALPLTLSSLGSPLLFQPLPMLCANAKLTPLQGLLFFIVNAGLSAYVVLGLKSQGLKTYQGFIVNLLLVTAKYVRNFLVMRRGVRDREAVSLFLSEPVKFNMVEELYKATHWADGTLKADEDQRRSWVEIKYLKARRRLPAACPCRRWSRSDGWRRR